MRGERRLNKRSDSTRPLAEKKRLSIIIGARFGDFGKMLYPLTGNQKVD